MRAPSSARSHRPCSARPIPWPAGTEHLRKRPTTGGWSCRCGLRFSLGLVLACLFLNALQVFKIGAAAGRLFIGDEILQRNDVYRNTEDGARYPARPRASELNSGDLRQDIYPDRSYADLIHDAFVNEGVRRYSVVLQRSAELRQRVKCSCRVLWRVINPHIQVLRVARLSVLHDSVAADDEILNLTVV